jgi:predicted glutamine amidotransferase
MANFLYYYIIMCRLFFSYYNKNTKQKIIDFLKQSSQKQKHTPGINNHRDHVNHQDGFGIAWMKDQEWQVYKKPLPYTQDHGFESRLNRIPKNIVIGHLRKIHKNIVGERHENNTHPFIYENQLLIHNGYVDNFDKHREMLLKYVEPEYMEKIGGETDTEIIFFMLLSIFKKKYKKRPNVEQMTMAVKELFHIFESNHIELTANFIFANNKYVMITRYLFYNPKKYKNVQYPPSLYYSIDKKGFLVVSEPITDDYRPFPMNTMMILDHHTGKLVHTVI